MINKKYLKNLRSKAINQKNDFIFNLYYKRIIDSLDIINLEFNNILILGSNGSIINNYLQNRYKNASFTIYDYSINNSHSNFQKSKIDLDSWTNEHNKFDLILSNYFLNLVNNFDSLIGKIINSLIPNGLFLATLPAPENFLELKNAMIQTDIEFYNGAYNRFNPIINLYKIIEILKKNNFMIPLVNLEKINLEYKNFDKLLNDVRSMNLSYYYEDKKNTFERKKYFNKLEKNFRKNSVNNYKLSSSFYIISGWKDHPSQQKPLKPGEAENKLKDYL